VILMRGADSVVIVVGPSGSAGRARDGALGMAGSLRPR
jgi:hypothetical protein